MNDYDQIVYKGLPRPAGVSAREECVERLLDQILEASSIPVSPEKVEQDLQYELMGFLQAMRYRAMGGDHTLEEIDPEIWKEEMRQTIIRDHKIEVVLSLVIEKEALTVTPDELQEAAEDLAHRENTTLDMVRSFLGEDYSLLRRDVLRDKARAFILEQSV